MSWRQIWTDLPAIFDFRFFQALNKLLNEIDLIFTLLILSPGCNTPINKACKLLKPSRFWRRAVCIRQSTVLLSKARLLNAPSVTEPLIKSNSCLLTVTNAFIKWLCPVHSLCFRTPVYSYLSSWINEPGVDVGSTAPRWLSCLNVVICGGTGWLASLRPQLQQTSITEHLFPAGHSSLRTRPTA